MMKWKHHKEDYSADVDVARSIAILDRVISEFDDIESDFSSVTDGVGSVRLGSCRTQSARGSSSKETRALPANDSLVEGKFENKNVVGDLKKAPSVSNVNGTHRVAPLGNSLEGTKSSSTVTPLVSDGKKDNVRSAEVVSWTSAEQSKGRVVTDKSRYSGLVQNYVSEVESRINDENVRNHTIDQMKSPGWRELSPRFSKPKRSNSDVKCSSNIASKQANLRALGLFQPVSKTQQTSPADKKSNVPVTVKSWKSSVGSSKESLWTKNRTPPTPSAQPVLPPLPVKLMQRQLSSPHISLVPSKAKSSEKSPTETPARKTTINRYVSSVNLNQEQTSQSGSTNGFLGSQTSGFQTPKRSLSTANLSANSSRVAKKPEYPCSAIDRLSNSRPDFKKKTAAPQPPHNSAKTGNLKETVNVRLNISKLKEPTDSGLSQADLNSSSSLRHRFSSGSELSASPAPDSNRFSNSVDRAIPQLPTKTRLVRRYSSDQGTISTHERRPHARKKKERGSSSGSATAGTGTSSLPKNSTNISSDKTDGRSKTAVSGSDIETGEPTSRRSSVCEANTSPLQHQSIFQSGLSPLAALNIGTSTSSNGTSAPCETDRVRVANVPEKENKSERPHIIISANSSNSSSPNIVSTDESDSSPGNRNSRRRFSSSQLLTNRSGFNSTPESSLEMKSPLTTCSSGSGMQKTFIFSPIVKDRLNDNSNMYIPAPPSPRPDYYESELSETDSITGRCLEDEPSLEDHTHFGDDPLHVSSNSKSELAKQSVANTSVITQRENKIKNRDFPVEEKKTGRHHENVDANDEYSTRSVANRLDHKKSEFTAGLKSCKDSSPKSLNSRTPLDMMIEDFHRNLPPPPPPPAGFEDLSNTVADESNSTVEDFFVEPDDSYYSDDSLDTSEENREKYSRRRRRKSDWMTTSSFDFIHHREARKRAPTKLSIRDEGISSLESHNSASDDNDKAVRRCLSIENMTPVSSRNKRAMVSEQNSKKFDSIRKLIREGKLEGLCSPPPNFTPPPPPTTSSNVKTHQALGRQFSQLDPPSKRYSDLTDQHLTSSPRRSLSQAHVNFISSDVAFRDRDEQFMRKPSKGSHSSRNILLHKNKRTFSELPAQNKSVLKISHSSTNCSKSSDDGVPVLHHFKEYSPRSKPARRPPEGTRTNALTHLEPSNFLLPLDSSRYSPSSLHQGRLAPSSLPLVLLSEGQQKLAAPTTSSKLTDGVTNSLPSHNRPDCFSAANRGLPKQRSSVPGHKLSFSNKEKEASETRGKFRIFKGFWRRKQYSLEHA